MSRALLYLGEPAGRRPPLQGGGAPGDSGVSLNPSAPTRAFCSGRRVLQRALPDTAPPAPGTADFQQHQSPPTNAECDQEGLRVCRPAVLSAVSRQLPLNLPALVHFLPEYVRPFFQASGFRRVCSGPAALALASVLAPELAKLAPTSEPPLKACCSLCPETSLPFLSTVCCLPISFPLKSYRLGETSPDLPRPLCVSSHSLGFSLWVLITIFE